VTAFADLSPAEQLVLDESRGYAQLWELVATWTNNADEDERRRAVPALRDAVLSLLRRGLVEVYDFPAWPPDWDQAVRVPPDAVAALTADVENWMWRGGDISLVTVSVSEAGASVV
jgi:hypothetical protein